MKHKLSVRIACLCSAALLCVTLFGAAIASAAML